MERILITLCKMVYKRQKKYFYKKNVVKKDNLNFKAVLNLVFKKVLMVLLVR